MKFSFAVLIVFFSLIGYSQVVNIENKRKGDEDKKLIGKTDLTLDLNKSISSIFTAKNSTHVQYHDSNSVYLFLTDLQFMRVDTVKYLNNGFFHFRYNYNMPNEWLTFEAFTQVQFNRIQKIQRRFLWGGGTRFKIFDNEKYKVFSGLASMYEFELYLDNSFQDKIRMSNYASFEYKPIPEITIKHTTYYQPQINEFSNFRMTNETSLEAQIIKNLRFRTTFNHTYDSKPAHQVQKVFYRLSNGFVYRFS